jgi:PAS domain S-box-containing protein
MSKEIVGEPSGGLDSRFREVMDAAPVMIWVSGKDKLCVWFNGAWLSFTGRSMAQELGNGWAQGVHPEDFDRCLEIYVSHFEIRKKFRMQYRLRRSDGTYRWIDDTGIPRYARDSTFLGYIGSCTDIHEQRKIQKELQDRILQVAHLNRTAAAGALSASIAHELGQPLTAIQHNVDAGELLLAARSPDLEEIKEILNEIGQAGQRAATIIRHLRLFLKRRNEPEHQLFDLNEAIAGALQIVGPEATERGVMLRAKRAEPPPFVRGDKILLEQVLLNLVTNGIDALTNAASDDRKIAIVTDLVGASLVKVSVLDSGIGIPSDKLETVFDTFYTTKSKGIGLGLSIARTILEGYGGKLWAESREGRGAAFHFTLPLAKCDPDTIP